MLRDHLGAELKLGREIHPAARAMNFTTKGKADDDCKILCSGLRSWLMMREVCLELENDSKEDLGSKCQAHTSGLLDW